MSESDAVIFNEIYTQIYNNIDHIMEIYHDTLHPDHNNTTSKYIKEGYDLKEAMSLSFMTTLSLFIQSNFKTT
jgi:hypothetical protein